MKLFFRLDSQKTDATYSNILDHRLQNNSKETRHYK